MSDAAVSLSVLAGVVVLFLTGRVPVEVVAIGSALVLFATGVIGLDDALAGFGDPTVILIAALFVVSEGLDATGVTRWVGDGLLARAGDSRRRLLLLLTLLVAGFTALINLNGSVAALLPMVVVIAVQRGLAPSKLLMPLAFAGSAGSLLLLTGSPVNVIVAEAAADAGVGRIGFAEFALVGVPITVASIAVLLAVGDRLLPDRAAPSVERDLSNLAGTLVAQYELDAVVDLRVPSGSPVVGRTRDELDLDRFRGVRLLTARREAGGAAFLRGSFAVGDVLTAIGTDDAVATLQRDLGLEVDRVRRREEVRRTLLGREGGVAEVVVPPRSRFVGETLRPGQVVANGSLLLLAVQRQTRGTGDGPVTVAAGDVLLVEGTWDALDAVLTDADVLLVDSPQLIRRRAVPLGPGSRRAMAVLVVMVLLLATGVVPAVVAALLAAGAMVLLRVLSVQQAYRRISWTTVLLVAGIIPLSTAIRVSGAGERIASELIGAVGGAGPLALLTALFLLTAVFGQLISNTATALIVIPIAVSSAEQLGVSAKPVLLCVLVAASAAFLTPVATPANMMVMGPAGYRFGDYWRLGLPMVGVFFLGGVLLVPLIWPL